MRARAVGAECARALEEREGFGRSGDATVFGRSVRSWSECLGSVGVVSDETTEAEKERSRKRREVSHAMAPETG